MKAIFSAEFIGARLNDPFPMRELRPWVAEMNQTMSFSETTEEPKMTAYRPDMIADPDLAIIILKAIRTADYAYNIPSHPLSQTNPDGVRYETVAHLNGLREADVTQWVAEHSGEGVHVMVAFARGLEMGQLQPGHDSSYEIVVSREESDEIRRAARAEMLEHLRQIPNVRYDHLIDDPEERSRVRREYLLAAGVAPEQIDAE